MAYIPIPATPVLDTDHVTAVQRTDMVLAEFVNGYYQRFLENDAALAGRVVEVEEAIDNMPTETDYDTAASYTEPGHIVDCLVIGEMKQSFQAGCSQIAGAITGGRDGEGTGGVPTAGDASLATMTGNITTLAVNNYNDGIAYADGRVNTASASYSAGKDSVVIVDLDFGNDWWNPSDTSGTNWDYKTKNISSLYANYAHITQSNITAFIKQFSGTGGNDLRVKVNSYTPSTGVISIGCNGNLNHLQVSLVIRPS